MTQFATAELADVTNTFVQAAEPQIMADALNVILQAASGGNLILALALAGGGDGHTFVVSVERSTNAGSGTPLDEDNFIGCYLASSAEELETAKNACVAAMLATPSPGPSETLQIIDDQIAGSSKGTRFMGMIIALWHGGE